MRLTAEGMARSQTRTDDRAFAFLRLNERQGKPRTRGLTEIRGPYYTPMGKRYLQFGAGGGSTIDELELQPDRPARMSAVWNLGSDVLLFSFVSYSLPPRASPTRS
jgi:hypothetical protein